jgi:hypothetical protein
MAGMASLSTSVTTNERCAKNAKIPGSICEKCFASTMSKRYPSMNACFIENQRILTGEILPAEKLPEIDADTFPLFRFESFGDINNATQVKNYFNICRKNPGVKFALWTKNPDFVAAAIADGYEKPANLNIILSSLFINVERKNVFPFVDKVFTVYDADTIDAENVKINCGAKSCFSCRLCYEKNGIGVINEKLK